MMKHEQVKFADKKAWHALESWTNDPEKVWALLLQIVDIAIFPKSESWVKMQFFHHSLVGFIVIHTFVSGGPGDTHECQAEQQPTGDDNSGNT